MSSLGTLDQRSITLRLAVLDALGSAGAGHVGPSFSCIEILRVLYDQVARHRPSEPDWPDRDRVILSKGHACVALYVLLADHGYFPPSVLATLCARNSPLGGHPERHLVPGIELCTGSLGHGPSVAVGIALALRRRESPGRVFVVVGDGELGEGSVWEALMSAAHHRLANICILVDRNGVQSSGATADVLNSSPLSAKLAAFGFSTRDVDGHSVGALHAVLADLPFEPARPSALICRTIKGRGIPAAEGNADWHYRHDLSPANVEELRTVIRRAARWPRYD